MQNIYNKNKLVGFISGLPVHLFIIDKEVKIVEINFIYVQSSYRSKRLAPVLIKR